MGKQIIVSGIQPTGKPHIGNYLGALRNYVKLQDEHEAFYFIASYHSLTGEYNPKEKYQQILDITADLLALGLDPKKATLFNQSDVLEHTELAWIFNTITPISELEKMTQYKDKSQKQAANINVGLFDYPVLQAADILIYHAQGVPIGQDQEQHLELTRKTVKKFNNKFGNYFKEPKSIFTTTPKVMSLVEPTKKMSKSYGNNHCIYLTDEPDVIKKKISKAVTGTGQEKTIPPGAQNFLTLLKEFGSPQTAEFEKQIKNQTIKYSELKTHLTEVISAYFADFRAKREELANNPQYLEKVLKQAAQKAQPIAQNTMKEVKKLVGLTK